MRRRIRRVRLQPRPFFVLGLVLNVVAGVLFSPVTAVRKVRVEGAPPADEARLTGLLQALRGVPCVRVDPHAVESAALQNSELRTATLSRTPFGSAVLRVARRIAVARLYGSPDIGLSEEGVLFRATEIPGDLPLLDRRTKVPSIALTLGNAWPTIDVAHLALLARGLDPREPVRIGLLDGGRVCLNIGNGSVDLGRCERIDEKIAQLRAILDKSPNLFATVASIDLVKVDSPTYLPRPGSPSP